MAECHFLCNAAEGVHAPDCPNATRPIEPLYVAWIPVGKGQIQDEGAIVGTEWACRMKAMQWLEADDVVEFVNMAPIPSHNVCQARLEECAPAQLTVEREF